MPEDYRTFAPSAQAEDAAAQLTHRLELFLTPLLLWLDRDCDQRLVRTFLASIAAIITLRERAMALLLSQLGAYLAPSAAAGTKRLSNLIHSAKWQVNLIYSFLWFEAGLHLSAIERQQDSALLLWDDSVLEKPESLKLEGLCAVRSSKAKRLTRIRPGYYQPPKGQVFVPGQQWAAALLVGLKGRVQLATMRWWSTRGKDATDQRTVAATMLTEIAQRWGKRVIHIFDRGYAGEPWPRRLCDYHLRFVIRWPNRYRLQDLDLRVAAAWQLVQGKRNAGWREMWDISKQCWRKTGLVSIAVRHPNLPYPLWLVVSRPGQGREPWYLLTNEPVNTLADGWRIVEMYRRRWQIEMAFRYLKSELGIQSPRLWQWQHREKLLLMASLAYGYLLQLLDSDIEELRHWLLDSYCHRTGKRSREVAAPLYRLRWALSRLWLEHPPQLNLLSVLNSG
jgi:hypothetical protein